MNPIENRHIERILSLIVILYGLWLPVQYVELIVWYALRWLPLFETFFSEGFYASSRIVAGCCMIVFFPYVVRWVGYFSTHEKIRSERRWSSREIAAVPLTLLGLTVFLETCCSFIDLFVQGVRYGHYGWSEFIMAFFALLLFVAVIAVFLCYARLIATWLLRKAD